MKTFILQNKKWKLLFYKIKNASNMCIYVKIKIKNKYFLNQILYIWLYECFNFLKLKMFYLVSASISPNWFYLDQPTDTINHNLT